jgi:hypothetical protein
MLVFFGVAEAFSRANLVFSALAIGFFNSGRVSYDTDLEFFLADLVL